MLDIEYNFIGGKLKKGYSSRFTVKSPFYDYKFELPNSSQIDFMLALSEATKARIQARSLTFTEREAIVIKAAKNYTVSAEEIDHLVMMTGMPRKHVLDRVHFGKQIAEDIPELIKSRYGHAFEGITKPILRTNGTKTAGYEHHRPIDGLIAAFIPPNDPAEIPFLLAHIVMYGGTAIIKPSSQEPYFAMKIARLFTNAGYPPGALNVLHWDTEDKGSDAVSRELIARSSHRIIMGGSATADLLLKRAGEDGNESEEHYSTGANCIFSAGNSRTIVDEVPNISEVADLLIKSAYDWTRDCVTTKAAFVVGDASRLIQALKERLSDKNIGDPLEKSTDIGYVENGQSVVDAVRGLVEFQYATLHHGSLQKSTKQIDPFLLETTNLNCPLLQSEYPYTLIIVPVATLAEAVRAINKSNEVLEAGMSMAVSYYTKESSMKELYSNAPEKVKALLQLKTHMIMYNKPSVELNVYLRHQDKLLTEFLTEPLSISE